MEQIYFNGKESAAILGVHESTVKKWKKKGKMTPQFVNGKITFYTREYLETIKAEIEARKK